MNKLLSIVLIFCVLVSLYFLFIDDKPVKPSLENDDTEPVLKTETISNMTFAYRVSPDGYSVNIDKVSWSEDLMSRFTIFNTREYNELKQWEYAVEYPPAISISVFRNPNSFSAEEWTKNNPIASNIDAIDGSTAVLQLGGEPAVFYKVLGLYLFDTYVIAYKGEIYLLSGAYQQVGDSYYDNLLEVLETITFK
jgi:hypothetical protein